MGNKPRNRHPKYQECAIVDGCAGWLAWPVRGWPPFHRKDCAHATASAELDLRRREATIHDTDRPRDHASRDCRPDPRSCEMSRRSGWPLGWLAHPGRCADFAARQPQGRPPKTAQSGSVHSLVHTTWGITYRPEHASDRRFASIGRNHAIPRNRITVPFSHRS